MSDVTLDPYIYFKGQAREAMEFYKGVFGGELSITSYSDVPGMEVQEDQKDWAMHIQLSGGDAKLFASDTQAASDKAAKIELALGGEDETRLREIFGKLSDGGEIKRPLQKESWGDIFGALRDKYQVEWMVNIAVPKVA
jgi:PhnB protein